MKKVLALILSVMLALCVFSACGEEKKKASDEDRVQAAVCEYVDLLFKGSEGALGYVVAGSENYSKTEAWIAKASSIKTFAQDNGVAEEFVADVNFQIQNFYNGITNQIDCDVTSVSVEDGKASVIVNISTPDLEKIAEITEKIKAEGRMEQLLTPEELAEYAQKKFSVKYMQVFLGEVAKELSTTEKVTAVTFELEKIEDEWLIIKLEGNLF